MKKQFILVAAILLPLLLIASLGFASERAEVNEEWVVRRDGVIVEDRQKTTSMLIPNPGATPEQVRRIVREENKRSLKPLLDQVSACTKQNQEEDLRLDKLEAGQDRLTLGQKNVSNSLEDVKRKEDRHWRMILWGLGALAAAALGIAVLALVTYAIFSWLRKRSNGSKENNSDLRKTNAEVIFSDEISKSVNMLITNSGDLQKEIKNFHQTIKGDIGEIKKAIAEVPTETSKMVKKLDESPMSFENIEGHDIVYTPKVKDNTYLSLYVVKSAKEASGITRLSITDRGKLRNCTRSLLTKYYKGGFDGDDLHSRQQKSVIEDALKSGELKAKN